MQTTHTIYNFNAGPAMLPVPVMQRAQEEFLNYQGSGMSLMEMSHRGKEFQSVLDKAEEDLRFLLNIPSGYEIGFFPGGATLQFSCVPLNLLDADETADFALTGVWSVKAFKEARKFSPQVRSCFDGSEHNYHKIPQLTDSDLGKNSKFLYLTSNNTIFGTRYPDFPKLSVPIVADMTSDILSRPLDISQFGVIFAGAQKNIGPSGITVVIARKNILTQRKHPIPILLDWKNYLENHSLYNTPPTYSIYIAGLVFGWLRDLGGVSVMEKQNETKSQLLYEFLDGSSFYSAPVPPEIRSRMNVVFHLANRDLEKAFTEKAENNGLKGLPGHRDAGGFRASIYNAMPIEGVESLIDFMREFERTHG